jgi:hypothetical protein
LRSHVQPHAVIDFDAAHELRIEIEAIEAVHGPNPYSDYLRRHGCRPDAPTAATIGRFLGGQVKAADGSMQPRTARKKAHQ